jgi:uncharacterized protein
MVVVSDTSPICNLALIGRLELIRSQFGEVSIPPAVERELDRLAQREAVHAIQLALAQGWITTKQLHSDKLARILMATLDAGEAEAIALAVEERADWVLLDERDGRSAAERAGLRVTGVLGVLLRAKHAGQIESVRQEIIALRERAGFFLSAALEFRVLQSAGE